MASKKAPDNNGDDLLHGTTGADILDGGNGDDILFGDEGADNLIGGNGNDTLYAGDDSHQGTAPDDYNNPDILSGGNGNDVLYAGEDAWEYQDGDTYSVEYFGDILDGGNGNDTLYGSTGGDTLTGGNGDDALYTDAGYGSASADVLDGGSGSDMLYVQANYWSEGVEATLTGGKGDDVFDFTGLTWSDGQSDFNHIVTITDFNSGSEKIVFAALNDEIGDFKAGSVAGSYVENLVAAESLDALGTAAAAAHAEGSDYYFGVFNGDGYLVADDGAFGWGTVIKLAGVTDMEGADILVA
ncbi:calcium-binding protein [Malikia sp.]|uniref:calcium-binding protein n=1 Tax=Malikia sp. TaxID=2070706 RepID=UPI002637876E|nr:calcium-binding protein [Malikia sp.]MDD2729888.1 calcium-binding protein [Malikia sp.]